jgi:hypothetical protein
MLVGMLAAALAASPYRPLGSSIPAQRQTFCSEERKLAGQSEDGGRANLPFAMGKSFATLDAYLAHLQCFAGPIDKPWWREIRPGVYEHVMSATNARPEIATRAELMKRFGFSK